MKRWSLRGLSVLAFAHGASDFYSGTVPFLIFWVVSSRHLSPVYQGVLGFVWYFTSSIVQPAFGYYSDRRGHWWFLPTAVLLTACSVSMTGLSTGLVSLTAVIVLGGLGSAIMHPEAGKYSAMLSGERKAGGIAIFQIGGQLGFALGPVTISLVIARYGTHGSIALLLPGVLAATALFVVMSRVARRAAVMHAEHAPPHGSAPDVDKFGVGLLVATTGLKYLVGAAFITYLPNLLIARGSSVAVAGETVTAYLIVGILGMFAGGWLADRFGAIVVSIAALCGAVPFLLAFFVWHGAAAMALLLIAGVLLAVQNAPSVAIVQHMLPRNLGMALGLMNGVAFGIGSALVAVVGIVVASAGPQVALQGVSFLPLLCAASYVLVARRLPHGAYVSAASRA
ncbi:MAG: MFS transporter [Candidatus Eremiobacteraeota bacterium]|nr:MFS transporter [Candidatus Eremiobacteraeota bacterium]